MSDPGQFEPNEAWIVFRLNDAPICTEIDGDFNVLCLMDAASCYILDNEFVPAGLATVPRYAIDKLLQSGKAQARLLPSKLLVSAALDAGDLAPFARQWGIEVVLLDDAELLPFISEAREGFQARFAAGRIQ